MKYCFVDCETTGTDPLKHGLVQLAGVIAVDGKIADRFKLEMCTFPDDKIEDEALNINGLDRMTIASWPTPFSVYTQLIQRLGRHCNKMDRSDKYHMIGYNADFDAAFIRKFFEKCGDKYFGSFFWWPIIDVSKIAGIRLMRERHLMNNFQLSTVASHMGVPFDRERLHDAMADVDITIKLFKLFMNDIPMLKKYAEAP